MKYNGHIHIMYILHDQTDAENRPRLDGNTMQTLLHNCSRKRPKHQNSVNTSMQSRGTRVVLSDLSSTHYIFFWDFDPEEFFR